MTKTFHYIMLLTGALLLAAGCTKDNTVDSGKSKAFDGTMLEYFASNSYDFDTLRLMITRAGIETLFETGKMDGVDYGEITLLGPTNHSIRRWMVDNSYQTVNDIDPDLCKSLILKHVIKGKYMRREIPEGKTPVNEPDPNNPGSDRAPLIGGQHFTSLGGVKIWLYTFHQEATSGGPIILIGETAKLLGGVYYRATVQLYIGSSDISTTNGVVHALNYNYSFNEHIQ